MTPSRSRRRLGAVGLILAVASLAGCGGGDEVAPLDTPITELGGPPTTTATATETPSETPSATETPSPTESPSATPTSTPRAIIDRVATRVATATAAFQSAHLDVAVDGQVTLRSDHRYGPIDDYRGSLTGSGGQPAIDVRRVDDVLYVNANQGQGWKSVQPGDPRLDEPGLLMQLSGWDIGAQLFSYLDEATDAQELGVGDVEGTPVAVFRFEVPDAGALTVAPGQPVDATGAVTVTLSVDADFLPVRLEYDYADSAARVDYSGWGDPVDVTAPPTS